MDRNKKTYLEYIFTRADSNDNASVPVDSLRHEFAHTPLAGECFGAMVLFLHGMDDNIYPSAQFAS